YISETRVRFGFGEHNAVHFCRNDVFSKGLQFQGICNLGRRLPARLLSRLASDTLPALVALRCRRDQMSIAPPGDHGNNSCDSDLRALLDRPLHAIKFEDS